MSKCSVCNKQYKGRITFKMLEGNLVCIHENKKQKPHPKLSKKYKDKSINRSVEGACGYNN